MIRVILFIAVTLFILVACGGEREGTVKYDDCREKIYLEAGNLSKIYKTFTCQYEKRASGKIIRKKCVHVDLAGGVVCETAYIYYFEEEPDDGCNKAYPFKGYNNICYKFSEDADWSLKQRAAAPPPEAPAPAPAPGAPPAPPPAFR